MFELWGFREWFLSIWLICYTITYINVLIKDSDIDKALRYAFVCGLFWPIMWLIYFINLKDNK